MRRRYGAASIALLTAACATPQRVDVPEKLRPGAGESVAIVVPARGVQIYECRATRDQKSYEWTLVAPEADLFDARGTKIGWHDAGPSWGASDGSKVQGTLRERVDAPRADAIPWLLISTKSVGTPGMFSSITSIQRVNTVGGVAPASGCSQATAGASARVPYTADYYMLSTRR